MKSAELFRSAEKEKEEYLMRTLRVLVTLGIFVFLTGCILSLEPLYTEDDIVFEEGLVGQWEDDNGQVWEFSKNGTNAYTLVHRDSGGKKGVFQAHLLKINGNFFLDLIPEDLDEDYDLVKGNVFYYYHFIPVHSFLYVKQIEPTLQAAFPDHRRMKNFLEENPGAISHKVVDSKILLTASSEEMQKFWLEHLDTEGVFINFSDMQRRNTEQKKE